MLTNPCFLMSFINESTNLYLIEDSMKAKTRNIFSDLKHRFRSERGITAIEYALLAALIAVAIIGGATLLGDTLDGFFSAIAVKINASKPS